MKFSVFSYIVESIATHLGYCTLLFHNATLYSPATYDKNNTVTDITQIVHRI